VGTDQPDRSALPWHSPCNPYTGAAGANFLGTPYHGRLIKNTRRTRIVVDDMRAETSAGPVGGAGSASRPPAIEIRDLSLTFETADGPVHALASIDLRIQEGEFVSLIGPSGCGKTTLLRLIADLEQPTSGALTVNGLTPQQARLERRYGYVFQAPALYPWRTLERNVMLPLEIMGMPAAERRERA
jgi:ABC-type glutathione transport system ATPase component